MTVKTFPPEFTFILCERKLLLKKKKNTQIPLAVIPSPRWKSPLSLTTDNVNRPISNKSSLKVKNPALFRFNIHRTREHFLNGPL